MMVRASRIRTRLHRAMRFLILPLVFLIYGCDSSANPVLPRIETSEAIPGPTPLFMAHPTSSQSGFMMLEIGGRENKLVLLFDGVTATDRTLLERLEDLGHGRFQVLPEPEAAADFKQEAGEGTIIIHKKHK